MAEIKVVRVEEYTNFVFEVGGVNFNFQINLHNKHKAIQEINDFLILIEHCKETMLGVQEKLRKEI